MKMRIEPVYPKLNVKELKYVEQPYIHVIEDEDSRIRVQGDSWADARRKFALEQWKRFAIEHGRDEMWRAMERQRTAELEGKK